MGLVHTDTRHFRSRLLGLLHFGGRIWLLGLAVCPFLGTAYGLGRLFLDFLQGGHGVTEFIVMWLSVLVGFTGIFGFQIAVCCLPTLPVQALATALVFQRPSIVRALSIAALTGLSALATAYLYDDWVPGFRWYTDDRPDWVHGMTSFRYCVALLVQASVLLLGCMFEFFRQRRREAAQQITI